MYLSGIRRLRTALEEEEARKKVREAGHTSGVCSTDPEVAQAGESGVEVSSPVESTPVVQSRLESLSNAPHQEGVTESDAGSWVRLREN